MGVIYEYRCITFGLVNVPFTFQRVMMEILSGLNFASIIFEWYTNISKNISDHFRHLKEVIRDSTRITQESTSIKVSSLKEKEISWQNVSEKGIQAQTENGGQLVEITESKSRKDIRKIRGTSNGFAHISKIQVLN